MRAEPKSPVLFNRRNWASLVRSGFQDAADETGAGRYGASQPTLLSHGILSLLRLRLPPTVCVHMYTVRVCMCASCILCATAPQYRREPFSRHAECTPAWIHFRASPRTRPQRCTSTRAAWMRPRKNVSSCTPPLQLLMWSSCIEEY